QRRGQARTPFDPLAAPGARMPKAPPRAGPRPLPPGGPVRGRAPARRGRRAAGPPPRQARQQPLGACGVLHYPLLPAAPARRRGGVRHVIDTDLVVREPRGGLTVVRRGETIDERLVRGVRGAGLVPRSLLH